MGSTANRSTRTMTPKKIKEPARSAATRPQTVELAQRAREALTARHGRDVVLLDVRKVTNVTDMAVVVTGGSGPQLKAMATSVLQSLREVGVSVYRNSGSPESGWIVLDYVDVVIHIFLPQARLYYAVEELWAKAPRLE